MRFFWWHQLENDPNLDSIRSEPEFQVMVEEIETDMAEQLERIWEMERNGVSAPAPGLVIEP